MSHKFVNIADIKLSSTPASSLLDILSLRLKKKQKTVIVTPNPEIILRSRKNKKLFSVLLNADFALADGIGLVWGYKFLTGQKVPRITGRQFAMDLIDFANQKDLKVYLLGATQEVNQEALAKLQKLYPNLQLKGESGPFLDQAAKPVTLRDRESYYDTLNHINKFKPDILLIAFGAPKQELWLAENKEGIGAKIMMTVGGTLDYVSGKMYIPPSIVGRMGLEWLWRLGQDPKRIIRIFRAVVVFPLVVIKEKFF